MKMGPIRFLRGADFRSSREEIDRQNRSAIQYFAIAGIPVSLANILAQTAIKGAPLLTKQAGWMLCYHIALFLVERFVLPKRLPHATLAAYLIQAPVMLVSILLGTVWDPSHQAMTFLMFMAVMPIFILDRPLRVMGVTLGWNLLFLGLCLAVKDPDTFRPDLLHTLEFFMISIAVTYVVLRLRLEVLNSLERTRYHLEHDPDTNTRNGRSLERNAADYVGDELFVAMASIDHLTLYNDFYGAEVGNELLASLADVLKREFGERHTYRLGGNEIGIVALGTSEQDGIARFDACRLRLRDEHADKIKTTVTYSFGYTTGRPTSGQVLHDMFQLAGIYAHQALRQGAGKTIGNPFSDENLRAAIVESGRSTHVPSYEVHQLTGLPRMPYFVTHCDEMLATLAHLSMRPVIGFFNIVGFRKYNDEYGFVRGDNLLRAMTRLLDEAIPNRYLCYISGSQFAVMCYLDEALPAARHVQEALASYRPGKDLSVHVGFAEYEPSLTTMELIDRARLAHEHVDARGGQFVRFYDRDLDKEIRLRQHLVSHLDQALEDGWLKVHYQPIFWSTTNRICNFEALSRWKDPIYGLLSPVQFISALEEEHLIYRLSLYVVKRAFEDLKALRAAGLPLVPVSVNLSRTDFFECDMVEEITAIVDASGLPRELLSIEITESAFAESPELLAREVDRFHSRGFAVWMDDFGSEYSTLNLLEDLRFDLVKLDMRFMRNFDGKGRNSIIVSSVVDMCARLSMITLAEGVETEEQRQLLCDMGCDKLQGYLYSPPRSLPDLVSLIEARGWMG